MYENISHPCCRGQWWTNPALTFCCLNIFSWFFFYKKDEIEALLFHPGLFLIRNRNRVGKAVWKKGRFFSDILQGSDVRPQNPAHAACVVRSAGLASGMVIVCVVGRDEFFQSQMMPPSILGDKMLQFILIRTAKGTSISRLLRRWLRCFLE